MTAEQKKWTVVAIVGFFAAATIITGIAHVVLGFKMENYRATPEGQISAQKEREFVITTAEQDLRKRELEIKMKCTELTEYAMKHPNTAIIPSPWGGQQSQPEITVITNRPQGC